MTKKKDEDILNEENAEDHGEEVASEEIDRAISEAEMAAGEAETDTSDAEEPSQAGGDGEDGSDAEASLREGGDGGADSPPQVSSEELEKLKAEAKENHDRYLRSAAEFENFKKRMERERAESIRYANEDLIKQLLPVVDNLERALTHAEEVGADEAMIEGVSMVHKQFVEALEKFGVTRVEAMEKPFDPNFHEAMMQVETDEHPPNTVVMEMAKGYLLHDRLIRPAIVGVSKAAGESTGG